MNPLIAALVAGLSLSNPKAVEANNDFGVRLLHELDRGPDNVMISPVSIGTALSMALNGAAGTTRQAMLSAMGRGGINTNDVNRDYAEMLTRFAQSDPDKVSIHIANSLWAQRGLTLKNAYKADTANTFKATLDYVDFAKVEAYRRINSWVSTQTKGKIPNILPEDPDPGMRLVLVNAIYFKSNWKDQFDAKLTRLGKFNVTPNEAVETSFMVRNGAYKIGRHTWGTAVSLPYSDSRFEMVMALPAGDSPLDGVARRLIETDGLFEDKPQMFTLSLPKWKSEYGTSLTKSLKEMGMGAAFGSGADFSGISSSPIYISDVIHKSFIEVNEEGTEAAAATAVHMRGLGRPTIVSFDKPFVYAIRETSSGHILFLGTMRNPTI